MVPVVRGCQARRPCRSASSVWQTEELVRIVSKVTIYGIHTNAQNKPLDHLLEVWSAADRLGFDWISLSDHFSGGRARTSVDTVVAHTAMAHATRRARCAVLVYAVQFRPPIVLAGVASTIDHLSGGRVAIGVGAGWDESEFRAYGFPFLAPRERIDQLEEALACVRRLLHEDEVIHQGRYFSIVNGAVRPRPVQPRLPVIVGVGGGARGLNVAARLGDGWNSSFGALDDFTGKRRRLRQRCEELGRDPAEVPASVNLGFARRTDHADSFAAMGSQAAGGVLRGSVQQIVDRIGSYVEAGADQINLVLQHPWDHDGLAAVASKLGLVAEGVSGALHGS
jgi:alkanesulfonate monooxygenase SsuD/methylene tetrahydromethanopterin reductase-like flavin-dependent oxidoreductase (luciferase family)